MRIQMNNCWRDQRSERGAVAIMTALLSAVLLMVLAFVTDFGMAYANKRVLQNGADAAALAVAQEIVVDPVLQGNASCQFIEDTASARMRILAEDYFARNVVRDGASLAAGDAGFDISCDASGRLLVSVGAVQDSPTFFGGVATDTEFIPLDQSAKAIVAPAGSVTGLRPFALCQVDASTVVTANGVNVVIPFDNNVDGGCSYAPGNWGVLDYDGGSNPATDTEKWIREGYQAPITVPGVFPGDPGAPSPGLLADDMDSILDEEIVIPVFDLVTGTGSGSSFRITGFVGVQLCGWKFNNKVNETSVCGTPIPAPIPQSYIQVRFKRLVAAGDINASCQLGTATCDAGLRMFKLAE